MNNNKLQADASSKKLKPEKNSKIPSKHKIYTLKLEKSDQNGKFLGNNSSNQNPTFPKNQQICHVSNLN